MVGGGLTGCVIASRLSQRPDHPHVLLLEAGPDASDNAAAAGLLSGMSLLGGELDYAYQSEPVASTAGRVHTLNAGKALGGGSVLNFGGWLRADAVDYDDWAAMVGDKRWSYEGMKPWFRKTETYHDTDPDAEQHGFEGPMHVTSVTSSGLGARQYLLREPFKRAWAELGVSFNPRRQDGRTKGLAEMCENSHNGMRQPSHMAYPLDKVDVLTNTVVHRVIFTDNTATGVELADGRVIAAKKEIILCAGTYKTPQILMLSGVGPSATLGNLDIPVVYDSPHVGQNLHDHFAVYFAYRLRDPSAGYALGSPVWKDPDLFKCWPWDWVVNEPTPADIMKRHMSETEKPELNRYEVITIYAPPGLPGIPMDGTHITTSTMLLRPTSRGEVSIRSSDPKDQPLIKPNYFSTPVDRDTLIHAARRTLTAMLTTDSLKSMIEAESPPSGEGFEKLTPLTADASDEEIEDRIRHAGMQHHHSGGTTAMGKVVDEEGRVLGVKGLRVADASIIPMPLGGHPQATLYPMAEQLASFVT
jgi:choline dehydrogenase-like flavoprotein